MNRQEAIEQAVRANMGHGGIVPVGSVWVDVSKKAAGEEYAEPPPMSLFGIWLRSVRRDFRRLMKIEEVYTIEPSTGRMIQSWSDKVTTT